MHIKYYFIALLLHLMGITFLIGDDGGIDDEVHIMYLAFINSVNHFKKSDPITATTRTQRK